MVLQVRVAIARFRGHERRAARTLSFMSGGGHPSLRSQRLKVPGSIPIFLATADWDSPRFRRTISNHSAKDLGGT